jgi:hypothetical protein
MRDTRPFLSETHPGTVHDKRIAGIKNDLTSFASLVSRSTDRIEASVSCEEIPRSHRQEGTFVEFTTSDE